MNKIDNPGFYAAEAEIKIILMCKRGIELKRFTIALPRQPINMYTARVRKPQNSCNLVKGLSRSVIPGAAYKLIAAIILAQNYMAVPT